MATRTERPPAFPRSASSGFCEVLFPPFSVDTAVPAQPADVPLDHHLILRRGVTGSLDLHAWWNKARRGTAQRKRTVKIQLLSDDRSTVVLTWRFRNARPLSLTFSPLRAMEGAIAMNTLALAFDSVDTV